MDPRTLEVTKVVRSLMAELDTPRSLSVKMLWEAGEWAQLAKLSCDPLRYSHPEDYLRDAAATDFLRKLEMPSDELNPRQAAVDKWWEAERLCFATNRRMFEIRDFGTLSGAPLDPRLATFVRQVKKNVLWLIGEAPPPYQGRFGPGATMSDLAGLTTVPNKMSTSPTVTLSALNCLIPWTESKWAAACAARQDDIHFVKGNSFFTVPKTSLTHRPCAKEPSINGFYQLGLGRALRSRLYRRGVNLVDGQSVHRQVACASSVSGELCTIDLSSASDTVSKGLVELLLPDAWFQELSSLRSPKTFIDGKWVLLEKFSSMGNGYTFELETTIFMAIAMAVTGDLPGDSLLVYGDDIICRADKGSELLGALAFFGMVPNWKKSFLQGPFRESCGGDFFRGKAVRPHFLKELPNEPQHFIALANGIKRLSDQFASIGGRIMHLRRTWFVCLDLLPSHLRTCRGPVELGDIVIHDDSERWVTRWRSSIRYVKVYRPSRPQGFEFRRFDPDVQFAAALYGVALQGRVLKWPDGVDLRTVAIRGSISGYKVGWVPYS